MRLSAVSIIISVAFVGLLVVDCARPNYVTSAGLGTIKEDSITCQSRFASGKCLSYAWETNPTEEGFASFIFKSFRQNKADGSPVLEDLTFEPSVVLWMPGMGHGSSPVTVERLDIGTYRASKVSLYMHGQWEIRFLLKDRNEIKDHATIALDF